MKRRTGSTLYGADAPLNVGSYGVLGTFLCGSGVALVLAVALLSLLWGPPAGSPLVSPAISRPWSGVGLVLISGLLAKRRWRLCAGAAMAVLLVFAFAPLYSPFLFMRALMHALRAGSAAEMTAVVSSLVLGAALVGLLAHQLMHAVRLRTSAVRGSTRWGTAAALKAAPGGFLLGRVGAKMLRYDGDGHLLTIAATRSGKGVGAIIPNLLNHPGSVVVTDPKGENFYVSGRYRRDTLGQEVVAMDPFGIARAVPQGFNPMDLIDFERDDFVETAMIMAEMIITRRGSAEASHWFLEGKALLFSLILHVADSADSSRRNLIEVRRLLTLTPAGMKPVLNAMLMSEVGQVREGAGRIMQKSDRERSGVFSTAQSYTHFLSSPRMHRVLTQTDFALEDLLQDNLSLFLILPREHLMAFAPWLRLMIACSYYMCTHDVLQRQRPQERVLFLLDEFANLGYMSNIKEAVSLGGGYGVTMWLILQDMAQLRREYRDEWESFVANSDVLQLFAIQDPFTTEKVAQMLGQTTVWQRRTRKASRREGSHLLRDYDEVSRPLLRPEELRRLHPDRQLLLVRPYQPVVADKVRYYRDAFFAGRFDSNPYVMA